MPESTYWQRSRQAFSLQSCAFATFSSRTADSVRMLGSPPMKTYTAVVERSPETGLFVGFIPGVPGAHTQAESLDELNANLREVLALLLEDGEPLEVTPIQSC
jgi:predicted RNase H-like HicB family nuclease